MKPTTIIYCGEDGEGAKALASSIRETGGRALFTCGLTPIEAQDCEHVVIMPDVPGFRRKQIEAAYPGKVGTQEANIYRELAANLASIPLVNTLTFTAPIEDVTAPAKPRGKRKPQAA